MASGVSWDLSQKTGMSKGGGSHLIYAFWTECSIFSSVPILHGPTLRQIWTSHVPLSLKSSSSLEVKSGGGRRKGYFRL